MKKVLSILVLACSLLAISRGTVWGGAAVIDFRPGHAHAPEELVHLGNKGLVAEFLDPGNTGLGKALGFLVWREILTAISDQAGAGVIVAHPPGDEYLSDMLKRDYHTAALEVARSQKTWMALWGSTFEEGGKVYIETYLTLLPDVGQLDALLAAVSSGEVLSGLEVHLSRTKYNFAMLELTREELFHRPVITGRATTLYAAPKVNSEIVEEVSPGVRLQGLDMDGRWMKVQSQKGNVGFIRMHEHVGLKVPPRIVEVDRKNVNLRKGPGRDYDRITKTSLQGSFKVLDMRYRHSQGLWYQIDANGREGWIAAFLVRERFSLPVVHFMAGLYRFQARRYKQSEREFHQFIRAPKVEARSVNLATAYQLIGAVQLKSRSYVRFNREKPFEKAMSLTPYNPAPYTLRALARLVRSNKISAALPDLEKALELDSSDRNTLQMFHMLDDHVSGRVAPAISRSVIIDVHNADDLFKKLRRKYEIRNLPR
jgi:SH3-like domain-containing protein